jgi:hypothetical protein
MDVVDGAETCLPPDAFVKDNYVLELPFNHKLGSARGMLQEKNSAASERGTLAGLV